MLLKENTLLYRGGYRIVKTIGRGGFGVTYLAEQSITRCKVCIKEFFPKYCNREGDSVSVSIVSSEFVELFTIFKTKFLKEAQTIAALDHPNIVHVYDAFEENNTAYYVMEYIEGESLNEMVKRRGALSENEAIEYIRDVAKALGYLHERHIMHLDVKPANIVVHKKDKKSILIDFGLSKHYDALSGDATSISLGGRSPGYSPKEQYEQGGVSTFSPETDIYSLGATLYYLVTGITPPPALVVADDGLPSLPKHISNNIVSVISQSMVDKRKDRLHSIKAFLDILDNVGVKHPVKATDRTINDDTIIDSGDLTLIEKTKIIGGSSELSTSVNQPTKDKQSEQNQQESFQSNKQIVHYKKSGHSTRKTKSVLSRIVLGVLSFQPPICLHLGTSFVSAWVLQLLFEWWWCLSIIGGFLVWGAIFFQLDDYRIFPRINILCWVFIAVDVLFLHCVCLDELLFPILSLFS